MKKVFQLFLAVVTSLAFAHRPIDCFKEDNLLGGAQQYEDDPFDRSDFDLLLNLDRLHLLTSVKVCTDRALTYIRGVQVSYGKFLGNGEIVDAVYLNDFGDLDQATSVCENFYIPKDDYIS